MTQLFKKDINDISTELLWKSDGDRIIPIGFNILYCGMPIYTIDIDESELCRIIEEVE